MKGKVSKLRSPILVLMVLVLGGAAVFVSTPELAAQFFPIDPICYLLGYHTFSIVGQGDFSAASMEEMEAVASAGRYVDQKGMSVLPIHILGIAGRGHAEGVGETIYWMDKSRPVEGSMMRGKTPGRDFPAVHEMRFHLLLTTDALPGRTFRSINPAIMVNNNALSFPPKKGSQYELKNVVEAEDAAAPGVVVVRILGNKNQIVDSGRLTKG